jgi:hypothetical protein
LDGSYCLFVRSIRTIFHKKSREMVIRVTCSKIWTPIIFLYPLRLETTCLVRVLALKMGLKEIMDRPNFVGSDYLELGTYFKELGRGF